MASKKQTPANAAKMTRAEASDASVDEQLEESFPASDAPAHPGTTAGSPRGGGTGGAGKGGSPDGDALVDEEGDESFPASDPPSHTGTSTGGPAMRRDRRPSGK